MIFYRLTATETEVVRIVHGARDLESIFRVL
jgi:plasmid stabilization system protein ParE